MKNFSGYKCSLCGAEYLQGQVTYTCPKDGGNLDIILDYETIKKKFQPEDITSRTESSLWRYLPLLPVDEPAGDSTPLHAAGWTPVFALPRLAEKLKLKHLWLKDESPATTKGFREVFVRAVWRQKRLVDIKQILRETGAPPRRNTDILGVSPSDFSNLTRSLFDRLP